MKSSRFEYYSFLTAQSKWRIRWLFLGWLLFSLSITGLGQGFNFKSFNLRNHQSLSGTNQILSGPDGLLYLNDRKGWWKFDGRSIRKFIELDGLNEKPPHNLIFTPEGYYFILDRTFFNFSNNTLQSIFTFSEPINTVLHKGSSILFGTENGFFIYDKEANFIDVPESMHSLNGMAVREISIYNETLLLATSKGLWAFDTLNYSGGPISGTEAFSLVNIEVANKEHIWAFDDSGNVLRIKAHDYALKVFRNPMHSFTDMLMDKNGNLWLGTSDKGFLICNATTGIWSVLDKRKGLPAERITSLTIDQWGRVWTLTPDLQLISVGHFPGEWEIPDNTMGKEPVTALTWHQDTLAIAGSQGQIYRWTNNKWLFQDSIRFATDFTYTSITKYKGGYAGITTSNTLVFTDNKESTIYGTNNGYPGEGAKVLASESEIWLMTKNGNLFNLTANPQKAITFNRISALSEFKVSDILLTRSGSLIWGTDKGLLGVSEKMNFGEQPTHSVFARINGMTEGDFGEIFISTLDNGIWKWNYLKNDSPEKLELQNYRLPLQINAIAWHKGDLAFTSSAGLIVIEDVNESPEMKKYMVEDGMPYGIINEQGLIFTDSGIWIGTENGLLRVFTSQLAYTDYSPVLQFRNIEIGGKNLLLLNDEMEEGYHPVRFNNNKLSIAFEAVMLHDASPVMYSTKLEGLDSSWSDWDINNNQQYIGLPSGKYTLRVKSRSAPISESEELSFNFEVLSPFWKTWWFFLLVSGGIFSISGMIVWWRVSSIRKESRKAEEKLRLENRLMELEQKAARLQMNPHFIFNALHSIQATVSREDYESARKEIAAFSKLMRAILTSSRLEWVNLEEELDLIRQYVSVEERCRSMEITLQIDDAQLKDIAAISIPPMILQPFIENAIVHGFKSTASGNKIRMTFKWIQDSILMVTISDNGLGYEEKEIKPNSGGKQSFGIAVTRERLEHLLPVIVYPVIAIHGMDSVEGGTKVELKIPVKFNY